MPGRFQQSGMPWDRGFFALLLILIVLAAVAWFAYMFSRQSGHLHHGLVHAGPVASPSSTDALKILNERFARGEIDAEEFTKRRDLLRDTP